jgi:hypothetical protein
MSTTHDVQQLTLWPEAGHRNHYLFSDYYLNARLPTLDVWWKPPDLTAALAKIKSLWTSVRDTIATTKEPQTREYLINPILGILGHVYEPEPSLPTNHTVKAPDYGIFADRNSMRRAALKRGSVDYFKLTMAVAEAKRYGRPLDQKSREGTDPFDNNNPGFQIDYYLRTTGLRWGILTDGRYWRLYNRDTSFRLNSYYEVDLISLVEQNNEEAFKYFYLFFRREAFLGAEKQESFLDLVFRESAHYARAIGSKLQDAVYEALETLCEGFVAYQKNGLDPRLQLREIYDNPLILLYRLLFIFHAESRGLLPLDTNQSYRDNYSLDHLKRDIAKCIDQGAVIPPDWTSYWAQLRALFKAISEGSPPIDVYEYNGGLFDPSRHEFLMQYEIGDSYLARALDLLARAESEQEKRRAFVDYRDLAIQHLGSIYEGLLEHKPRVADEEMVIIREKGREKVVPRAESNGRRAYGEKHRGEIYLALEKGERKATGSYYTPDYIVKYIVENTLGTLVREKIEGWRRKVLELQTKVKGARGENRAILEKELENTRNGLADEIMSLRVLDPAMGSGHFLVRATEYLAEELATNPDIPPPTHDGAIEDVDYWKRRVVERCIYGVDVNPLAVELAKVSLWLSTAANNKPLSFLDHHLRCGNSLIGARLTELGQLPVLTKKKPAKAQPASQSLLEYHFHQNVAAAVDNYFRITALASDKLQEIQEKEKLYGVSREILKRYREVAHVRTSMYFGNDVPAEGYMALQDKIGATDSEWAELERQPWFTKAVEMSGKERCFFHWELEFPESFFDRNGNPLQSPGFSAVIGNPPYDVIAEKEQGIEVESDKSFYGDSKHLKPALGRKLNYYRLFSALSIWLSQPGGAHGFIVPMALIGDIQAEPLRRHMLTDLQLMSIEAFPQKDDPKDRVFEDAKLSTCVYTLHKQNLLEPFLLRIHPGKLILETSPQIRVTKEDIELLDPYGLSIPSMPGTTAEHIALGIALAKRSLGHHFGEIAASQQGEVNLTTHFALLSSSQIGPEVLRGAHVDRYELNQEPKQGIPAYLRVEEFLRDRRPDSKAFDHKERRIGYQRGAAIDNWRRIIACVIEPGSFCSDTINYLVRPKADFYFVLGLLNSSLYEWRFRLTSTNNHVNSYEVDGLPLRPISFTTPKAEREQLSKESKRYYEDYLQTKDWDEVLSFVGERLPQKPDGSPNTEQEQSDVVHDLLAFLAEEMTRLHKETQAEAKGFLIWLEGYLGVGIEDLKNKTKVKEYWKAEVGWEGFIGALEQNKKVIQTAKGIDVTRREPQEAIRSEFDGSAAKLRLILERIELTDKLIDQIVYKLYGLTEQEIAIVEGEEVSEIGAPAASLQSHR